MNFSKKRVRSLPVFPLSALTLLIGYMYWARIYSDDTFRVSSVSLAAPHPRPCHSPSTSSYWEQLPRTQIIADAAEVAERIKAEARQSHDKELPTAVLFLSDFRYAPRFDEMIKTWSKFAGGKSGIVMAALDEATEAYFQERGVKTVRILPELLDAEKSVREAVLRAKVEVPYVFLLEGLRVLMVEMDIYCRSNPLHLDKGTADVLVAEHDYCEEVNVGFWIAYPTCPVIDSFWRMQAWTTSPNRTHAYCDGAFDQKLMHFAWLGHGALSADSHSSCREFAQRNQVFDLRINKPIKLGRISFQDIMHWTPPWVAPPDPETWPSNPSNPICVHIWSAHGSPDAQMRYVYRRKWFPLTSEREAEIALGQLDLKESKG